MKLNIRIAIMACVCLCSGASAYTLIGGEQADGQSGSSVILTNQGLGYGINHTDGSYFAMDTLAALRTTGLFVQISPEDLKEIPEESRYMVIKGNGQEWRLYPHSYDTKSGLLNFTDPSIEFEAGVYEIYAFKGAEEVKKSVLFRDMKNIRVLIVPISGYYSDYTAEAMEPDESLYDFARKVFPLAENDLEWNLYTEKTLKLQEQKYDLDTPAGRFRVFSLLNKMQGKEKEYDLIIGLVPENMLPFHAAEEESITGFTFGSAVSVISMEDTAPAVTVAHEIGHCFLLGDEYENGSFNLNANMVPYLMKGKNMLNLTETVTGSCKFIKGGAGNDRQGTGTLIYEDQFPFDIETGELIEREMTSFMGLSGYGEEEYFMTADTWMTMYHALMQ